MRYSVARVLAGSDQAHLAGDSHHVAFGRARATQHHLVFTGEHPIGAHRCCCFVQHTDGAILTDPVRHLVRVHPERELTGQELIQLLEAESDLTSSFADNGVHFVIDSNAAIPRAFEGFLGKPVMFVMLCERPLQGPAEDLQLVLADTAPGPEQAGHEAHGGGDLGHHVRPAAAAAAPAPALAHGLAQRGRRGPFKALVREGQPSHPISH